MFDEIVGQIRKLHKKEQGFIPLHAPVFKGNEKKYVAETIDSTFVSSVLMTIGLQLIKNRMKQLQEVRNTRRELAMFFGNG